MNYRKYINVNRKLVNLLNEACISPNQQEKYLYVLHLYRHLHYTYSANTKSPVRLSGDALSSLLDNRKWQQIKKLWTQNGVLTCNRDDFYPGKCNAIKPENERKAPRCQPYTMDDSFLTGKWERVELTSQVLISSLARAKAKQGTVSVYASAIIGHQERTMSRMYIHNEAYAAIDRENIQAGSHYKVQHIGKDGKQYWIKRRVLTEAHRQLSIDQKRDHHQYIVNEIQNENHFAVIDSKVHRLHSLFTQLPRYLRKYVQYELGGVMVSMAEVDITNCQLSLLAHLAAKSKYASREDVVQFCQICAEGRIYEHLMGITGEMNRDRMKVDSYTYILFGQHRNFKYWKHAAAIEGRFPNLIKYVKEIKADDYRAMSVLLQRAESSLMLHDSDSIMLRLIDAGIPAITIHDCVVVPDMYMFDAQRILQAKLIDSKVNAQTKIKPWK